MHHVFWICKIEMCTARQRFSQFCWFIATLPIQGGVKLEERFEKFNGRHANVLIEFKATHPC